MADSSSNVRPPLNFNATKPIATPYHLVNIRIIITIVNDKETSMPCNEKKLARLPSTTPKPIGSHDKHPHINDVAYVGITLRNSIFSIPNDNKTRYTTIASMNQKMTVNAEA